MSKVPLVKSFFRSQLGSICASLTDIGSLFILTEYIHIYYVISAGIASALGAVVGFLILRFWAFESTDQSWGPQAIKYGLTSVLILLLNMGGIYLFTDIIGFQYLISKLVISILIGIFVSFPLFRWWVYK